MSQKFVQFGQYTLASRIAQGGMAHIFLARMSTSTGKDILCAVKLILPQYAEEPDFVSMLIDEARLTTQLVHPNITQIHDLGKEQDRLYIAMEYIAGRDMGTALKRMKLANKKFDPLVACYAMSCVLRALDFAHHAKNITTDQPMNLVHRDVTASNILLSYDGEVKLIDFGIASAAGRMTQTQAGVIKGKYRFMSPEQVMSEPLDGRTDIYAAGITMYEMLATTQLYAGKTDADILSEKIAKKKIPPLAKAEPGIDPLLSDIIMKSLEAESSKRYQRANEFADALDAYARSKRSPPPSQKELAALMTELFPAEIKQEKELRASVANIPGRPVMSAMNMPAFKEPPIAPTHPTQPISKAPAKPSALAPSPSKKSYDDDEDDDGGSTLVETGNNRGPSILEQLEAQRKAEAAKNQTQPTSKPVVQTSAPTQPPQNSPISQAPRPIAKAPSNEQLVPHQASLSEDATRPISQQEMNATQPKDKTKFIILGAIVLLVVLAIGLILMKPA